jgi:hypothetical protein
MSLLATLASLKSTILDIVGAVASLKTALTDLETFLAANL